MEAELREQAAVAQVEARMGIREGDLKGLVTGEQLRTLNVYSSELSGGTPAKGGELEGSMVVNIGG